MKTLLIACAFMASTAAYAVGPNLHDVDFTQPIVSPMSDEHSAYRTCMEYDANQACRRDAPLTLGLLSATALAAPEPGLSSDEVVKRGTLAIPIRTDAHAQVTDEELKLIKQRIVALGRDLVMTTVALRMLDPTANP